MRLSLSLLLAGCFATVLLLGLHTAERLDVARGPHPPVVVELFTSEGCSSCPPADALLIELQKQSRPNAENIVLSEHVDYWNYIGWQDPYSAKQFSDRQSAYAAAFGSDEVYTPQMVVNGAVGFTGSDPKRISRELANAANSSIEPIEVNAQIIPGAIIEASAKVPESSDKKLFFAIAEDGLETYVKRGENRGRTIQHTGVVRAFQEAKATNNDAAARFDIKPDWNRAHLRIVAFVADKAGKIHAAGSAQLPDPGKMR